MRELPVLDPKGRISPEHALLLMLVLHLCDETDSIPATYAALRAEAIRKDGGGATSRIAALINNDIKKKSIGGRIAGHVFLRLLQLFEHTPEDASVNKSVFILTKEMEYVKEKGKKAPADRTYIRQCWTKYKSVAHLWAGIIIIQNRFAADPAQQQGAALFIKNFGEHAEDILIASEILALQAMKSKLIKNWDRGCCQ
ncbi:MAG: hypothetical protein KF735_08520 [Chelatococcus sp.]|uniref:hypothetical protein n=1 Tax=Chelatococcus sp. TaxID=1953771 RepID=UPI0025B7C8A3|nr:hypothetical protein [Chelatococcus sp.]MBX3537667.1 hypothetical protein [Chelatococcus sp.]